MKYILILTIVYYFFSWNILTAQEECMDKEFQDKLLVTKMVFHSNRDSIDVTVKSTCDACSKSVYTGIIIKSLTDDTLAIDKNISGEWTPENNTKRTYTAIVKKDFELSQDFKVGLVSVCHSIPIELNNTPTNVQDIKIRDQVHVYKNTIHLIDNMNAIQDVAVYNTVGQLVQRKNRVLSTEYELDLKKPGIYVVSVRLTSNEVVNIKYVNGY